MATQLYHPGVGRWKTVPDTAVASEQHAGWLTADETDVVAPGPDGRFHCPDCNKSYETARQLGGHRSVHRSNDTDEEN